MEKLHIPAKGEQGINIGVINNQRYYYGTDYYIDNKGMRHIREVPIFRSKQQKRLDALEEKYTSHAFKGKAEFVFDPHSEEQIIKRSMSLEQYLKEKIRRPTFGAIFLNERPISDSSEVNQLLDSDMSQIVYVKYYDFFRYGAKEGKTTLVYQLAPSEIDSEFGKRIDEQNVAGYLGGVKFQNKVYNQTLERLISDYDYRPTLYWNPDFEIQQQKQSVTFYNNSRAKGYWITIQGVTQSGKLVFYQKKIFKIDDLYFSIQYKQTGKDRLIALVVKIDLTITFQNYALNSGKQLQNSHELYSQYYTIDARGTRVLQIADVTRTRRSREIERLQNRFKSIEPATVHQPDTILLPLMDSVVIKTSQSLWEYMHRNLRNPSGVTVLLNGEEADGRMKVKRIIDEEKIRENVNPKLDLNEKPENQFLNEDVSNYPYMKFYSTYNSVVTRGTIKNVLVVFEYSPAEKNRDIGSSEYWETIAGYMPIKSFTNKVYPSAASRLSSGKDNRLTLYWDPLFDFTAQEDSKNFVFYNNSSNKGVWLTIQGLTEKGEVIYYRKQITNVTSSKDIKE